MCGIAGLWEGTGRIDLARLHQMSLLLRHRGPDGEGLLLADGATGEITTFGGADTTPDVFHSSHPYAPGRTHRKTATGASVGLLHRRLAILDLSPAGHQPMCDAGATHWITYNGEVYNYVELRSELEGAGETFTSGSDTEVILAAYRRWGHDCLRRFNGMFAFAIWDAGRGELFCARDRFGVKPFYYQFHGGRSFAFASEPRALAMTQAHRIRPRLEALRDLIALDWVDHGTQTCIEGIEQLAPGHFLVLSEKGLGVRRWWSLDPDAHASGSAEGWAREFAELFTDAVRIRLRSDVEVGSCLSGGLDSSAVVTTASQLLSRPIHAFSCAYDEGPAFDERPYVRVVAEASGAVSDVVVPDGGDFWTVFDRLTDHQGEPTAGPGLYSQWKVMELAHAHGLKVLLDGQGGDETLGGYFRYLPLHLRDRLAAGDVGGFFGMLGPVGDRLGLSTTLALVLEPWLPSALVASLRRRYGQGKDRVLSNALASLPAGATPLPPAGFGTAMRRQMAFDTLQRLLPSLLRYEDRNSMAFSIETRLPFLDYRLVEFAFALPDDQKLDGVTTKAILRRALADRVPARVLERRDKMGFETPADLWLRGRLSGEVRRRLTTPGPIHDWIDRDAMTRALEDYLAGRRAIGLQVWRWLSLESWSRRYLATDPRLTERAPERILHAGRHRSYVEVSREIERDLADATR